MIQYIRTEVEQKFIVGLDLGQSQDSTGMVFLDRQQEIEVTIDTGRGNGYIEAKDLLEIRTPKPATYGIRHIERVALGTPYPKIVERVCNLLDRPEVAGKGVLVIDQSGVGRPVFDMFKTARSGTYGVTITGGDTVVLAGAKQFRVSKVILVGTMQVCLQTGRVKMAPNLKGGDDLRAEMTNFRVVQSKAGNEIYGARESKHDDLVLSLALGLWFGEAFGTPNRKKATSHQGYSIRE